MTSFGRSFFGEATLRLQRLLGLDGIVPVEVGKTITPVVILGDTTQPGFGGQSGRRFGGAWTLAGGAVSTNFGIKAESDLIITGIGGYIATAGAVSVAYLGPAAADPYALTTRAAIFLDRSVNVEFAPLTNGSSAGVAETSGIFKRYWFPTAPTHQAPLSPFLMVRGSKLMFRWAAAVTLNLNVEGMTL